MRSSNPIPSPLRNKFFLFMKPTAELTHPEQTEKARAFMAQYGLKFGTAERAASQFRTMLSRTSGFEFLMADWKKAEQEREARRAAEKAERRAKEYAQPPAPRYAATYTAQTVQEACEALGFDDFDTMRLRHYLEDNHGE